jgi:ribose/xylose/arabinose/galactoside ABC-type transport system permease subunit
MLQAARGLTHIVTGQQTQYFRPMIRELTSISVLGLSLPFLIAVVIAVLGQIVLCRTVFGRYMVAIGTNEEAARLSGIDPRPIKLVVFTLCGLLAAVAALAQTTRLGSATPTAGTGFELEVIAAVTRQGAHPARRCGSHQAVDHGVRDCGCSHRRPLPPPLPQGSASGRDAIARRLRQVLSARWST